MSSEPEPKSPHNKRAEWYLVGCMLRDPDCIDDVREVVGPDHFFFDNHQRIVRAIDEARAANEPTDTVAIHDRLVRAGGGNSAIDDYKYLAACRDAAGQPGGAIGHARRIRELAVYRAVIQAANTVLRDANDQAYPGDELAARAEQLFLDAADQGLTVTLTTDADLIRHRLGVIVAGGGEDGLLTGLADLDRIAGPMHRGEMILVGARPSLGKTSLGLTVAEHVAFGGTPVLFVSLEMSAQQIGDRLLSMRSGVPMRAFAGTRDVRQDTYDDLARAAVPHPGAAPIHVYDRADATAAEIASVVRRAVRRLNAGLVVVDYVQLVRATNPRDNRVEQVADVSRRLKAAARNAGVPLVALAQLNRKAEERSNQRPKMSDLREGGSLEQDADKVILIHRKADADEADTTPGAFTAPIAPPVTAVELLVDKNRNGPTGDATVMYRRAVMRFENAAEGWR